MGAKVSAAPKQLKITQPSRVTGQMGMTRKECEENHPTRMQGSGMVLDRKEGVPSTPVTERQGNCWTQVEGQDRIALLSARKVMELRTTLGSVRVIRVSKSGWGQSFTRLRNSKAGRVSDAGAGEAGPLWHGRE